MALAAVLVCWLMSEWVGGWVVGRLIGLVGNAAVQDSVRVRFCGTSTVVVTASMGRGVAVWADVMLLQRLGV